VSQEESSKIVNKEKTLLTVCNRYYTEYPRRTVTKLLMRKRYILRTVSNGYYTECPRKIVLKLLIRKRCYSHIGWFGSHHTPLLATVHSVLSRELTVDGV
jgi:hypothetical protein